MKTFNLYSVAISTHELENENKTLDSESSHTFLPFRLIKTGGAKHIGSSNPRNLPDSFPKYYLRTAALSRPFFHSKTYCMRNMPYAFYITPMID